MDYKHRTREREIISSRNVFYQSNILIACPQLHIELHPDNQLNPAIRTDMHATVSSRRDDINIRSNLLKDKSVSPLLSHKST